MLMLTDICTGSPDYGFSASGKVAGRYRFARITDIDPLGRLKKNDAKFVDSDGGKILKENDVMIARTGTQVGKAYLYDPKDGELISSTLPFFTSESVEFIPDSRKKVVLLKSTELQVELKTIPLEVWASCKPRTNWNIDVPIKAGTLAYLVERTAYASDTKDSSDNRAMLNFSITPEGILNVTGLDLYRFAICTSKDKMDDFTKMSFTIPVKTLQAILPYLKDEEIVHLKKYTNEYAITSKRVAIYGHTPAADYYNIASYLTKYPSNSIRVDRKIFLRCCEVAAITNRTKISINIGENLMEISASGNGGKVENRMKIDGVVKSKFCVNPLFIMDILKKCPDQEIQMFYSKDGTRPLFFRGNDHIDMVLPIRC